MIKPKEEKPCCICNTVFKPFKSTQKTCSYKCEVERQKRLKSGEKVKSKQFPKRINRQSKKTGSIMKRYTPLRREYLSRPENKMCVVKGTNCQTFANTIEHTKGRGDYFVDDWAEERNIPLTIDERFWIPACILCNGELETNSELSKKFQFSKIHNGKKI